MINIFITTNTIKINNSSIWSAFLYPVGWSCIKIQLHLYNSLDINLWLSLGLEPHPATLRLLSEEEFRKQWDPLCTLWLIRKVTLINLVWSFHSACDGYLGINFAPSLPHTAVSKAAKTINAIYLSSYLCIVRLDIKDIPPVSNPLGLTNSLCLYLEWH